MGTHVDGLKFAGGSFSLFPEKPLRELIDLAHEHDVYVSTVSVDGTDGKLDGLPN
jgi:phosphosulfolactate synthase (CoM biosynthesis protein A)